MKKYICAILLSIVTAPALAGTYPDVHILKGEGTATTLTAEVFWSQGEWFGLSFADVYSDGSLSYFHNNVVNRRFTTDSPFYAGIEFGARGVRGGDDFLTQAKAGVGVRLTKLPFVADVFSPVFAVLDVTYYEAVGKDVDQWKINGKTKTWKINDTVGVYVGGFYRDREEAPNVFQPQVWFVIGENTPVHIGSEYNRFGDNADWLVGVKYNF